MISKNEFTSFKKDLDPIMNFQEMLLNIKGNEISINHIDEIITNDFSDKLSFRRVLSVLSSLMYSRPLNLHYYCQVLSFISPKIKSLFDQHEITSLFENKSALLVLLQNKLITPQAITQKFHNRQFDINFFFPEIETAKKPKNINSLQNDEFRLHGQNEDSIATIVRNDKVNSLIKKLRFDETLLNSIIHSSRYETFDFVESFGKKPSLIEYSAFFGSLNTFKYLFEKGADISEILPEFAVSGGNIEIIHLLEKNNFSFGEECVQASIEFCQNEIVEYLISSYDIKYSIYDLFESIKHFNYKIFFEIIQNGELCTIENLNQCLFYSIEYQNIDSIKFILKCDGIDVNVRTDFNVNILFFIIHL